MQKLISLNRLYIQKSMNSFASFPSYFTCDPYTLSESKPYKAQNYINGQWKESKHYQTLPDPLNGEKFLQVPDTKDPEELKEFVAAAQDCHITGLHNPLKNPERYQLYGEVNHKIAAEMKKKEVHDYFVKLIQRVIPKHYNQASAEVVVSERFFQNFSGDQPRFLMRSFNVAGDRAGQQTTGYRFPYGSVALITPFNFPLEIACLQMFGALIAGNKVFFKGDSRVNVVMEQFLRMTIHCGMPKNDVNMMFGNGESTEFVLRNGRFRNTLFTGSSKVANHLCQVLNGKIKLEDAGYDWKILGPDVPDIDGQEYVAYQCDQDAYACSGQKCSAQSILFAHENWMNTGLIEKLAQKAKQRSLSDFSLGPILTWNNEQIKAHIDSILTIPGAKLLFGGNPLKNTQIPNIYGAYEPTAIFVPLDKILDFQYHKLVTTELFGPFQIVTEYKNNQINQVLDIINRMDHHLTAGVVSNDINFIRHVAAHTVNGVTYWQYICSIIYQNSASGIRARTTGAPQNHWFGPSGDPRGAGIGSPEAILHVWTAHREVILDTDPAPEGFKGVQS